MGWNELLDIATKVVAVVVPVGAILKSISHYLAGRRRKLAKEEYETWGLLKQSDVDSEGAEADVRLESWYRLLTLRRSSVAAAEVRYILRHLKPPTAAIEDFAAAQWNLTIVTHDRDAAPATTTVVLRSRMVHWLSTWVPSVISIAAALLMFSPIILEALNLLNKTDAMLLQAACVAFYVFVLATLAPFYWRSRAAARTLERQGVAAAAQRKNAANGKNLPVIEPAPAINHINAQDPGARVIDRAETGRPDVRQSLSPRGLSVDVDTLP
jgi:hypothetical protein